MRRLPTALLAVLLGLACQGLPANLDVGSLLGAAAGPAGQDQVAAGLREALRVGTDRAVARTSRAGGFLDVPSLHIPLPESLQPVARSLRAIGLSGPLDRLEVGMNRAAELAAGEAAPVFLDAIRSMTLSDARAILHGGDTAATDFFRERTRAPLTARFAPKVKEAMQKVDLYRSYAQVRDAALAIPGLASRPELDLEGYVTDHTLDGLFDVLGQEERRIRQDPAARTTELLKQVFGGSASRTGG